MNMQIIDLWRYPIKGFGGSQAKSATLATDGYFPHDRHFAISTGGEKIANARSGMVSKSTFPAINVLRGPGEYNCQYRTDGVEPT